MKLHAFLANRAWRVAMGICALALMGGCATQIDKNATTLDLSRESVVVVSMKAVNSYRPNFPLKSLGFAVDALDHPEPRSQTLAGQHGASGSNEANRSVLSDVAKDSGEALVVFRLPPGRFKLASLDGWVPPGLLVGGAALHYSVQASFAVPPRAVVYLGHLDLVNRERTNRDEQASEMPIPVISQAAAGFSGGTLDVKLKDRYAHDLAWLHREYPATRNVDVVRAPLPALWLTRASGSNAEPIKVSLEK